MIQKLQSQIGQIEASIDTMAEVSNEQHFQQYCDHAYSCISYLKQEIVKLKKE